MPRCHASLKTFATSTPLHTVEPLLDRDPNSDGSSESLSSAWKSTATDKLLLILASIIPLLASTALLVTTVNNRSSTEHLLAFVLDNRATTQIVVYLVASTLAWANVYTVTKLLNFTTRIHLIQRSLSLNMIAFISAISTKSLVPSLPIAMFSISIIIVLTFLLPNVLWTGALTPILARATMMETGLLKIPRYSTSSNMTWSTNQRLGHGECNTVTNPSGIFSDCPVSTIQSSLLSRAAQASSNLAQNHSKNDNSHYIYVGRSYGVGSAAGLTDKNLYGNRSNSNLLSYNYTEPGYLADVTCLYNSSSDFHLEQIQEGKPGNGIPYVYYATGRFPNAPLGNGADFFAVVGLYGDANIATVAAKRYEYRNVILVTSGSDYTELNNTQCEVRFVPTMFSVRVDVANTLISVIPVNNTNSAGSASSSFDPAAGLASTAINQINGLGMISTSLYTSVVGDTLISNIKAASANSTSPSGSTALTAMADSFSVMLDDILLFIGSSQFFVPNLTAGDFSTVDVSLTVQAVKLGEPKYVFATFGMCVLLLAAVIVEACRTRAWRWLPIWDFMDTTCLVLASAVAGEDVVRSLCQSTDAGRLAWLGGSKVNLYEGVQRNLPGFRFSLGRKVLQTTTTPRVQSGDEDENLNDSPEKNQETQLTAVSLWTRGAKGIVRLE
ncbi:MAG: hypothetical protein Q9225_003943 [Loekoesia sp. 1 TL-2023]